MLAGGGTGGAEVIDDGLLRRGVLLNDGGLGGVTISAGELVVSSTFRPMLGSPDL